MKQQAKLSDDLKYWRAERPYEWTMDEFISKAEKLESVNSELLEALNEAITWNWLDDDMPLDVYDKCQAAIAKAEGKTK